MKRSQAVISSGLGSSAGVGPGKAWMGDAAGCGGGDSVGGPLPSQGGPQPTPSPGLWSTVVQENHLLNEMCDWGSNHFCSLKIPGHFYKVKDISWCSTVCFQLGSSIGFLVISRKRIHMKISGT